MKTKSRAGWIYYYTDEFGDRRVLSVILWSKDDKYRPKPLGKHADRLKKLAAGALDAAIYPVAG